MSSFEQAHGVIDSFRAEWIKLLRRPVVLVLLIFATLYTIVGYAVEYAFIIAQGAHPPLFDISALLLHQLVPFTVASLFSSGTPPTDTGVVAALVLGSIVAGSDYTWGTLKTALTQRPGRLAVYGGQVLALFAIIAVLLLAQFAGAAAGSLLIALLAHHSIQIPPLPGLGLQFWPRELPDGARSMKTVCITIFLFVSSLPVSLHLASSVVISRTDPFVDCPAPGPGHRFAGSQVEPSIAAAGSRFAVAAWQQDRWSSGGAAGIVLALSTDGRNSWQSLVAPFSSCGPDGLPYARATDPWVSAAHDHTTYLSALAFSPVAGPHGSTVTTASVVIAARVLDTPSGPELGPPRVATTDKLADKPAVTVNPVNPQIAYSSGRRMGIPGSRQQATAGLRGGPRASSSVATQAPPSPTATLSW